MKLARIKRVNAVALEGEGKNEALPRGRSVWAQLGGRDDVRISSSAAI